MRIEQDHRIRLNASPAGRRPPRAARRSMMRRFCMSGVSRHSGTLRHFGPGHLVAVAERRVGRNQQPVALAVERDGGDPDRAARCRDRSRRHRSRDFPTAWRMSSEVRDRTVNCTFGCRSRYGVVSVSTMATAVGMAAMRSRPARPCLSALHFLAHGAGIADDAARPIEDPLAFRGKILEPRAAIDQEDAECLFKLLDARPTASAGSRRTPRPPCRNAAPAPVRAGIRAYRSRSVPRVQTGATSAKIR